MITAAGERREVAAPRLSINTLNTLLAALLILNIVSILWAGQPASRVEDGKIFYNFYATDGVISFKFLLSCFFVSVNVI